MFIWPKKRKEKKRKEEIATKYGRLKLQSCIKIHIMEPIKGNQRLIYCGPWGLGTVLVNLPKIERTIKQYWRFL